VILLGSAEEAFARLGGGQSFGGGGGGSGGGGDGGGELVFYVIYLLIRLCIHHPYIGIPLTIAVVAGVIMWKRYAPPSRGGSYSSTGRGRRRSVRLDKLKADDPNFSKPLFLDFVQLLYARVQHGRGTGEFDSVRPYLMDLTRQNLEKEREALNLKGVEAVVIGRSDLHKIQVYPKKVNFLTVEFEVNLTERRGEGSIDFYAVEQWTFRRDAGVLSRGPEEIRTLSCPGCGSPVELTPDGTCTYCGRAAGGGQFHWVVSNIVIVKKTVKQPPLVSRWSGKEEGTDHGTIFQPDFQVVRKKFQARHPDFSWKAFSQKVQHIFSALQQAWSEQAFEKARPYESDPLFNAHRFWIERYKREGLVNRLEEIEIEKIQPCKIETDAFYEAITVRMFARMLDYTVDASGKVVEGSKKKKRKFSEYWTFLRRIGAKEGKTGKQDRCPNCGAPVKVNMAGDCEYCGSKVTTGDFDWVLSSIDQDETYRG
jgi:predicted lipid-binding transport protein (Tim44 family)